MGVAHAPVPAHSAVTTLNFAHCSCLRYRLHVHVGFAGSRWVLLVPMAAGGSRWGSGWQQCLCPAAPPVCGAPSPAEALYYYSSWGPVTSRQVPDSPAKYVVHSMLCCCFICLHLPVLVVLPRQKHKDLFAVRSQSLCTTFSTREKIMDFCWMRHQLC